MFLPYTVDVPMARMPIVNWVLIVLTVFVSLGVWVKDSHRSRRSRDNFDMHPDLTRKLKELRDRQAPDEEFEALAEEIERRRDRQSRDDDGLTGALDPEHFSFFQLFTHQFVHGDILHLAGNMLFLFVFGNAVNAKLGHVLFPIAYLILGTLAGLGWLMFGNGMPMIGASGAIMGIIGIFLVFFPRNNVSIFFYYWRTGLNTFEIPAFWVILFYMIADLIGVIRANQPIAYVSHLTGTLFGAAFAISLLLGRVIKSTKYEENLLQALGFAKSRHKKGRLIRDM
jgi:membrane associated rhomboid family serine protease